MEQEEEVTDAMRQYISGSEKIITGALNEEGLSSREGQEKKSAFVAGTPCSGCFYNGTLMDFKVHHFIQ